MSDLLKYTLAVMLTVSNFARADEGEKTGRTISTTGEATCFVVPDEVIVTLGVQTANPNLDSAKSGNDQASQQLVKAVQTLGIEQKHLATDNVQVALRYTDNDRTISAYVVTRMYMVTLKDIKKLEPLVDSALKNGANRLEGIQFRSSELRKHRDQARSMSIKAAKEKAVALAKDLDCTVGSPITINEYGGSWSWNGGRYSNIGQNQVSYQQPSNNTESGETLPLGQIGVQAGVSVSFDLIAPLTSPAPK